QTAFFLEPVAAVEASASGASQQCEIGFTVPDFNRGSNHLGQYKRTYHPGHGNDPQHGKQFDAADAGHSQDDKLIALGQACQGQDCPDQQSDGQQLVEASRQLQGLQIEQVEQGELRAHVVQFFDQGEKCKQTYQSQQDDGAGAIDFAGKISTGGTHGWQWKG